MHFAKICQNGYNVLWKIEMGSIAYQETHLDILKGKISFLRRI